MLSLDFQGAAGEFELNIKLDVSAGTTLIVGPNGSGKSSLLKFVLGARRPTNGRVVLGQTALFDGASGVNVPVEERHIGYVPQSYALFPHLSARENVEFGARDGDVGPLMEQLEIAHLADRRASVLSGGESQRVALARALAPGPRLLLLDEPMAALDQSARRHVREFLARVLGELDIPALVVTHEREDLTLGAQVAVLEGGRVVASGETEQVAQRLESAFAREFFSVA